MGVNFFLFELVFVPFEVVAFTVLLRFWTDEVPTAVVVVIVLGAYA